MSARRLSIALLLVLYGACFIVPASVLGENPWDEADRPSKSWAIDTTFSEEPAPGDTTGTVDQSLSSSPAPPNDSPESSSSWFYDMLMMFSSFFKF